jgi:hypothetical protein
VDLLFDDHLPRAVDQPLFRIAPLLVDILGNVLVDVAEANIIAALVVGLIHLCHFLHESFIFLVFFLFFLCSH